MWRPECCIFMIGSKILKIYLTEPIFISSSSFLPSTTTSDQCHAMLCDKELVGDGRGGDGNVEVPGRHRDGKIGWSRTFSEKVTAQVSPGPWGSVSASPPGSPVGDELCCGEASAGWRKNVLVWWGMNEMQEKVDVR